MTDATAEPPVIDRGWPTAGSASGLKFLETVIDILPCMVLVKRASDLTFVRANAFAQGFLGMTEPEIIGKSDRDLFDAFTALRIAADDRAVLDSGKVGEGAEESIESRRGRRWFWTQKVAVPGFDGKPEFLLTLSEDVTERRRLRSSSHLWEQMFQHSERGIAVDSPHSPALEFINSAFARMHGYTVEELAGCSLSDVVAPGSFQRKEAMFELVRQNGHHTFESVHLHRDGSTFPVLVDVTALRDSQGNVQHRAMSVQDISNLKSAELGLRADRAEAERANDAKSEFLSRMSHELRTPLNVILGFAQVMQLDSLSPSHAQSVGHIITAGRHLLGVIDDVLDISRVESGSLALSIESFEVSEIADEVLRLMRPLAERNGVRLLFDEGSCECHVLADRLRLKQVLLNLVSNGIKYNVAGGSVFVTCSAEENDISIAVADTGIGIDKDSEERLFAPFDRMGKESSEIEGSGLGLSICKGLVEAMGGTIGTAPNPGGGTIFRVVLHQSIPLDRSPELPPHDAEEPRTTGLVLYIEDNLANFQLVEHVLSRRPGVKVLPAMQASIGIELAIHNQPDLILLDLHLPDQSGEEVLRRLLANPETSSIPVVIASADATPRRLQRLLSLGASAYLTKPVDVIELLKTIDRYLPSGVATGSTTP